MVALYPSATTAISSKLPFPLVPIIEDLIRTRFPVSGSVFLVEDIHIQPLTESGHWQVLRLLLGDGELYIQAILDDAMHRFVCTGEISVGSYVQLKDFHLRTKKLYGDTNGTLRTMVFLVVYNLDTIGRNNNVQQMYKRQQKQLEAAPYNDGIVRDSSKKLLLDPESRKGTLDRIFSTRTMQLRYSNSTPNPAIADAFEESRSVSSPVANSSRISSHKLSATVPYDRESSMQQIPSVASSRGWHDLHMPLKLTTLRSIPNLPYQQNWSCNILAIVTYLSPVESSHLPPYKQRIARVADPSTAKRVHLTVFLDPEEFTPTVGKAVLLSGVKNHKYDGGSLKKYASDKSRETWWIEDPWELEWCDVKGIKAWWAKMEAYLAS